ncbi:MAG: hypothetical protein QNK28_10745 [Desulfobacterales bacterium]|nr:hypothetical protein [Desulfobacterales bacterium]
MLKIFVDSKQEITGIVVTSDWHKGIYRDSKLPYRKINCTVLYADTDGDDVSRYLTHVFISDSINEEWQPLKYKGIVGHPEGWAKSAKGSLGGGGGKGIIGSLVWLLLVIVNIAAGLIAGQDLLKSKVAAIEKVIAPLQPFSALIGVSALGVGLLSFILSVLSLHILAGIIPQLTAVALGLVLGSEVIKGKATGKLKEAMVKHEAHLQQVNTRSQLIGVAGLVVGVLYLFLGGARYVI